MILLGVFLRRQPSVHSHFFRDAPSCPCDLILDASHSALTKPLKWMFFLKKDHISSSLLINLPLHLILQGEGFYLSRVSTPPPPHPTLQRVVGVKGGLRYHLETERHRVSPRFLDFDFTRAESFAAEASS